MTGTKAAAAGGTTSVIIMPLNSIPAIVTGDLMKKMIAISKVIQFALQVAPTFCGSMPSAASSSSLLYCSLCQANEKNQTDNHLLQDKLWVDVGYWGGLVPQNAGNYSVLQGLLDAGALGFKSFMSPAGECVLSDRQDLVINAGPLA